MSKNRGRVFLVVFSLSKWDRSHRRPVIYAHSDGANCWASVDETIAHNLTLTFCAKYQQPYMNSNVPMSDIDVCNTSSVATSIPAESKKSSLTKPSVRKATKTKAKAPTVGKEDKTARRKPNHKPKRPLSSYSLRFPSECDKILGGKRSTDAAHRDTRGNSKDRRCKEAHGEISFSVLAKQISAKWKRLDGSSCTARAETERASYKREVKEWKHSKEQKDRLPQETSTLHEGLACPTEEPQRLQKIQNEVLEAIFPAHAMDLNGILSNHTMQRATNIKKSSYAHRETTIEPHASSFHYPVAIDHRSATLTKKRGQRSIKDVKSFQTKRNELGWICATQDQSSAAPNFCNGLQNDLRQLDELEAMLDNLDSDCGTDNLERY